MLIVQRIIKPLSRVAPASERGEGEGEKVENKTGEIDGIHFVQCKQTWVSFLLRGACACVCVCAVVIQVQVEIWRTAILSCAEGKPGAINLAHNRIARATGHSLRVFFCLFFAPRKCIVCIVLYLVRFFLPPRCVPEPKMCVCVCVHVKNWRIKGSLRMLYIRLIDRVCVYVCSYQTANHYRSSTGCEPESCATQWPDRGGQQCQPRPG